MEAFEFRQGVSLVVGPSSFPRITRITVPASTPQSPPKLSPNLHSHYVGFGMIHLKAAPVVFSFFYFLFLPCSFYSFYRQEQCLVRLCDR